MAVSRKERICGLIGLFMLAGILVWYYIWMPNGDDTGFHICRLRLEAELIQERGLGILPHYLYGGEFYGFGYAACIFYCDVFLYPFALLVALGVNIVVAYKLVFLSVIEVAFLTASFGIYEWKRDRMLAMTGGFLYILQPYFVVDVVHRAALGESLALAAAPLALCGLYLICSKHYRKGTIVLALGMGGVICSHVISTLLLAVLLVAVCVWKIRILLTDPKCILCIVLAALLCCGLTAWYWFPMLEQMANIEFFFSRPTIIYAASRATLGWSLFVPYGLWGTLYNKWNILLGDDELTFFPGGMIWIPILTAVFVVCCKRIRKSTLVRAVLVAEMAVIILTSSATICNLLGPLIAKMQFIWRWYVLLVPVAVVGFLEIIDLAGRKIKWVFLFASFLLSILTVIPELVDYYSVPAGEHYLGLNVYNLEGFDGYLDLLYIPRSSYESDNFFEDFLFQTEPQLAGVDGTLTYTRQDNDFTVQPDVEESEFSITFPLLMYKGYAAENLRTGETYEVVEGETGLVQVNVEGYSGGDIRVYYKGTVGQKVSLWISRLSGVCFLLYLLYYTAGRRIRRHAGDMRQRLT